MRLIITEKNIAAKKIADILADKKAKADKVYNTPVYYFEHEGVECVSVGLKGHILGIDFPTNLVYSNGEWNAVWEEGDITPAAVPKSLPTPPWPKNVKPYAKDGLGLSTWKIEALPYLVWSPVGKIPTERDLIRSLKSLAKKSDHIIIATDFDREGELIGSDARNIVVEVNPKAFVQRARYSAITKDEIGRAFANLTLVDDNLAQAGEARQDIDLIWGAVLTRYLTKVRFAGVGRPRSAGRVQTPTLKLIVDKEAERDAFVPEDFWVVSADLETDSGETVNARHDIEQFKVEAEAQASFARAQAGVGSTDKAARVTEVESKERVVKPPVPFNTTTLMAAAANEGLSPSRTMRIAESLYMNGLISYPRVDNTVYPKSLDLRDILRQLVKVEDYATYAKSLLTTQHLTPTRGAKETTDHPPIHPTGAAQAAKLRPEEWKLYNIVARRFMATLSGVAIFEDTKVSLDINGEPFVAKGQVMVKAGFREIYYYGQKKEDHLPALVQDETLAVIDARIEGKQTKPPSRYTEGGMITKMEKVGLGTKATRHDAIQKLIDRAYVQLEERALKPTMLGVAVINALSTFAERITTPNMTAELEAEMDEVAAGEKQRTAVVDHSRALLANVMDELVQHAEQVGEMLKDAAALDAKVGQCPKCGKDLLVRNSLKTRSQFVGCAGWPECDVTYPLPQGKIEPLEEQCASCGAPRIRIIQFRTKPIERCLNPDCDTNYEAPVDLGPCPTCLSTGKEGRILGQRSPRTLKRFARCTNHEECGTSYALPGRGDLAPTNEFCKTCGAPEVVVTTTRGPWRICINMDCPDKEAANEEKKAKLAARGKGKGAAKATAKAAAKPKAKSKAAAKPKAKAKAKAKPKAKTTKDTTTEGDTQ